MFLEFVSNFAILFSFTLLIYWAFIQYEHKPFIKKYKIVLVGVTFGVAALILTVITTPFANGVLIHNRNIFIVFSGLLGGPWALFITGMIIVSGRYLLMYTSTLAFIMMLNVFINTIALTFVSRKHPITYRNIPIYFFIITFEHISLLLIYYRCSMESIYFLILYFICSSVIFYLLRQILLQLDHRDKQIKQIYRLKQMDLLTQLPNHIATELKLTWLIQAKISFELLHLDLRKFSAINHQYSYEAGDEFFSKIAETIQLQLPKDTYISRIDSDEFYIVLVDTAPAEAILIANQINYAIKNLVFKQDPTLQITSAIGICSSDHYAALSPLLNAAYRALANAKRQSSTFICHDNQLKK
ncbi:diguanylate cyclase [Solibacillus sp.]|uniref:diguanylate cyclase domain-containing protein n=1 Tax=Solibacillus sp. TaxID=1909654 RepID=UPI00331534FE